MITDKKYMTLGWRNNNPLNIRYSPRNKWQGQNGQNKGFCVFMDLKYGFRAAFLLLFKYYITYGCRSVKDFITRFAPPSENNTSAYVTFVIDFLCRIGRRGVDSDNVYVCYRLDCEHSESFAEFMMRLADLLRAMVMMENGSSWLTDKEFKVYVKKEFDEGLRMSMSAISPVIDKLLHDSNKSD